MEINMPAIDGTEATKQIRASEEVEALNATPVIALTANGMMYQVSDYLTLGMSTHIAKPVAKAKQFNGLIADRPGEENT